MKEKKATALVGGLLRILESGMDAEADAHIRSFHFHLLSVLVGSKSSAENGDNLATKKATDRRDANCNEQPCQLRSRVDALYDEERGQTAEESRQTVEIRHAAGVDCFEQSSDFRLQDCETKRGERSGNRADEERRARDCRIAGGTDGNTARKRRVGSYR